MFNFLRRLFRHSTEFDLGYESAKEHIANGLSLEKLRSEWDRCSIGDDYDRGYDRALTEAEDLSNA